MFITFPILVNGLGTVYVLRFVSPSEKYSRQKAINLFRFRHNFLNFCGDFCVCVCVRACFVFRHSTGIELYSLLTLRVLSTVLAIRTFSL